MKRLASLLAAATFALLLYVPSAHAQYSNLPNQQAWNQYLENHPKAAAELRANPSLIYNSNWRSQHEHLEDWLSKHPDDWKAMRQPAPWQNRYGAWDKDEWRDQDWWYHNNPKWAHENHPDWWQEHKDWQGWKHEEHEEQAEHAHQKWEQHHHGNGHAYGHDKDHDND